MKKAIDAAISVVVEEYNLELKSNDEYSKCTKDIDELMQELISLVPEDKKHILIKLNLDANYLESIASEFMLRKGLSKGIKMGMDLYKKYIS